MLMNRRGWDYGAVVGWLVAAEWWGWRVAGLAVVGWLLVRVVLTVGLYVVNVRRVYRVCAADGRLGGGWRVVRLACRVVWAAWRAAR